MKDGCPLCGAAGRVAYRDLADLLYGVPGRWSFLRCPIDGHWWIDPLPEDLPRLYERYHTHDPPPARRQAVMSPMVTAAVRRVRGLPGLRDVLEADALWLSSAAPGRLLDVGCGGGELLERMARAGWTVSGVEPDPQAAERARQRSGGRVVAALEDLAGESPFDAVTLSHLIEHVPAPTDTLRRCWALVAPGGRLVVVTPNVESLGRRVFGRWWRGLEPPRHLQLFSRRSLDVVAREAGVEVRVIRTTSRLAAAIWAASVLLRRSRSVTDPVTGLWWLAAQCFWVVETLAGPGWGEELLLTARRPAAR